MSRADLIWRAGLDWEYDNIDIQLVFISFLVLDKLFVVDPILLVTCGIFRYSSSYKSSFIRVPGKKDSTDCDILSSLQTRDGWRPQPKGRLWL